MRILADTNILARIAQTAHRQHAVAAAAVERVLDGNDDPCIVPQILYEFWVVATKPTEANGLGMSVAQVQNEIGCACGIFTLLRDERAIFPHWQRLVADHQVMGKPAHDARLVAAMKRHGLPRSLTFNASDFRRFSGIEVLTPDEIVAI